MKNKILIFIVSAESLLILALGGFIVFGKDASPTEIYTRSLNSVFELKATTGTMESYGSAVCIDDEYLITNFHVVSYTSGGADLLYDDLGIRSAYEEDYHAVSLFAYDSVIDLAILRIDGQGQYTPVKISSSRPEAGKTCYAVGNASNMGISITEGIVSLSSVIVNDGENDRDFIQLDITLAGGSSGGALLDTKGRLVGINTLRLKSESGDVIYGYAYAIPITVLTNFLANHPIA